MSTMTEVKHMDLNTVWRVIQKFKEAVMRLGLNLYQHFQRFDPTGEQLISEYLFRKVLEVCLKNEVALSQDEIGILTEYFKYRDGRIMYSELCERVHDKSIELGTTVKDNLVTGLEWEDPLHINALEPGEEAKLKTLLNSIASVLIKLDHPIDVHFKEYEQIVRNPGCVSITHLSRILKTLSINLREEDFNLLVKRYSRHNFMFNYIPFLDELNAAIKRVVMSGGAKIDIRYILNNECDKVKRPDLYYPKGTGRGKEWGMPVSFRLLGCEKYVEEGPLLTMRRIKHHVLSNGIDINRVFQDMDKNNSGMISPTSFVRALTSCGINSGLNSKLTLKPDDVESLVKIYLKPYDNNNVVMCRLFVNDVCSGLVKKDITSGKIDENSDLNFIPVQGNKWDVTPENERFLCEETINKLKTTLKARRWTIQPFFREWDRSNRGYVTISVFRNVLTTNNLVKNPEELDALEKRYCDVNGFNYNAFLNEVRCETLDFQYEGGSVKSPNSTLSSVDSSKLRVLVDPCYKRSFTDEEISDAIRNIRRQIIVLSRKLDNYFKQFDPLNKFNVSKYEFLRVLASNDIEFTPDEGEILITVFKTPLEDRVDYSRFLDVINEAYTQKYLDKAPLIIPVKHIPVTDTPEKFLDMEQRRLVESAMDKLSNKLSMVDLDEMKCFDHAKAGDFTANEFVKFLDFFKIKLTNDEIKSLTKAFGRTKGGVQYLEYLPLLKICDILFKQKRSR